MKFVEKGGPLLLIGALAAFVALRAGSGSR